MKRAPKINANIQSSATHLRKTSLLLEKKQQ